MHSTFAELEIANESGSCVVHGELERYPAPFPFFYRALLFSCSSGPPNKFRFSSFAFNFFLETEHLDSVF